MHFYARLRAGFPAGFMHLMTFLLFSALSAGKTLLITFLHFPADFMGSGKRNKPHFLLFSARFRRKRENTQDTFKPVSCRESIGRSTLRIVVSSILIEERRALCASWLPLPWARRRDSAHRGCLSLPYSMKESTLRIVVAALPPLKGEHSAHRCCRSPGHAGTTLRIGVALLLRHASTTLRIVAAVLPKACRHHSAQSSVYSPLRHAGTTLRRAVYYSLLGMPAPLCAEVYHRRHAGTTLRRGAPTVR